MEYHAGKKELVINRKINELDRFVLDFVRVIEKQADYVIISGYISILLGRARATEDVDMFIKKMPFEEFAKLYEEIKKNGFWCINAEKEEEIYNYLKDGLAIRFARENKAIPNFEVKFPKNKIDEETFSDCIKVTLKEGEIKISSLERQIAFKRYYLKSDKDIEDAMHIEEVFKEKIDNKKIEELKKEIEKLA